MFDKGHVLTLGSNEYKLLETLPTQGGHAQVWRAQLLGQAGEFVVKYPYLKRISSAAGRKHVEDFIQRAKTEIALLQKFTPDAATNHICPLHDSGIVATRYGDLPVLVLPYLSGKFPEAIVDGKVKYDASTALRWLRQTAMALKYLHDPQQNCLIHRDLKPANILLDANGDIRLIDLGITKPERQANGETTSSMLSDKWAAPEQIIPVDMSEDGEWLYRLHTSMDIYALGLLAYYLFSKGNVIAYQAHVEGKHTSRRNSYWNRKPERLPWEDALVTLAELETKGIKDGKDERQFLEGVKALLAAEYAYTPPTGTLIGTAFPMLPDAVWVAGYLWEQVSQWLNPLPERRPDAQQVLDCLEQVEAALHPKLKALSLSAAPEPIILGEQPVFIVELEGSNLPPIGNWLEVYWGELGDLDDAQQVQWQLKDPQQPNGLVNGKLRLQLQLPAMQKAGDFLLEVSARVWQQDMVSASHAFKVVQTPQQLWDRGDKQAAVRLDPCPEWLDELERHLDSMDSAYPHLQFLRELLQRYPDSQDLAQRVQAFSEFRLIKPQLPLPPKRRWDKILLWGVGFPAFTLTLLFVLVLDRGWLAPDFLAPLGGGSPAGDSSGVAGVNPMPQQLLNIPSVESLAGQAPTVEAPAPAPAPAALATAPVTKMTLPAAVEQLAVAPPQPAAVEQPAVAPPQPAAVVEPEPTPAERIQQSTRWLEGDNKDNWKKAVTVLESLAKSGESDAMRLLGLAYYHGMGVTRNRVQGCKWYKQAANKGHADAKTTYAKLCR